MGRESSYAPYGLAVIKAVILAKFILVGHALWVGDRYSERRFVYIIAYKSVLFLVMLLVLSVIEETVVGIIHGRAIDASLAEVAGATLLQILASCLIMLLVLVPYLTFRELNEVLGEGRLRQLLFEKRAGPHSGGHRERQQG